MKSIANQYRDLKEGKMSQANFMRNLRMSMPQFVTNVTSFNDAVRILKNKSILTETVIKEELDTKKVYGGTGQNQGDTGSSLQFTVIEDNPEYFEIDFTLSPNSKYRQAGAGSRSPREKEYGYAKILKKDFNGQITVKGENFNIGKDFITANLQTNKDNEVKPSEDELDAILKGVEQEKAGEEAIMSQYDEELNEAKKKDEKNYGVQQANPTELRLGIRTELECDTDMELDKAKEIAYKNLAKDPIYYTKLKLSGVEAHPKKVKGEKEVPVKKAKKESAQLVDLVNGMQKVKMPKADEKKKIKESVDAPHSIKADQGLDKSELNFLKKAYADRPTDKIPEKFKKIMQDLEDRIAAREKNEAMRFKDLSADPEKYKIVRDSKNYIIKATNADGVEFQKGDEVTTYDGEKIKIAKFEESQGKVKAIYNKGMFFASIDIDGLEAPKATFRPGVNIGGSFEKMKRSLEEIVREVMAESPYGDNLIDPIAAEEENN
jgi:hypothetical protein